MATGPGKYDNALTEALKNAGATQGVLIVLDGSQGSGFSMQSDLQNMLRLPHLLETMATHIRADLDRIIEEEVPRDPTAKG